MFIGSVKPVGIWKLHVNLIAPNKKAYYFVYSWKTIGTKRLRIPQQRCYCRAKALGKKFYKVWQRVAGTCFGLTNGSHA